MPCRRPVWRRSFDLIPTPVRPGGGRGMKSLYDALTLAQRDRLPPLLAFQFCHSVANRLRDKRCGFCRGPTKLANALVGRGSGSLHRSQGRPDRSAKGDYPFWLARDGVAPAGPDRANSGHHHLLIDTELPPLDQPIPNDSSKVFCHCYRTLNCAFFLQSFPGRWFRGLPSLRSYGMRLPTSPDNLYA